MYDDEDRYPWEVLKKAADYGLYGPLLYERAENDESGLLLVLVAEELAWGCGGVALALMGTGLSRAALRAGATQEQAARWEPRLFGAPDDPQVAAFAATEPQAGSDLSAIATTAVRSGDEWVLTGRKTMITNGGIADLHLVVASVDPSLGHRGQAIFIVPRETAGFTFGERDRKLGVRASHTCSLVLEDVRVPVDQVVGGVDRLEDRLRRTKAGDEVPQAPAVIKAIQASRPRVAAQAVGVARAALEYAAGYANEREQFGRPIIEHQAVGAMLADMAVEVDASRLLVYRAAAALAGSAGSARAAISMAKLKAGETAVAVTEKAVQILGGRGFLKSDPVEKWYRDAKIYTLFEGTSQIHRTVIANSMKKAE